MEFNFLTASLDAQKAELMRRAMEISPRFLTVDETLAMYANENNWKQTYDAGGCHWTWNGPIICAPEAARKSLELYDDEDPFDAVFVRAMKDKGADKIQAIEDAARDLPDLPWPKSV